MKGDKINLYVDDELVVCDIKINESLNKSGSVYLQSSWDEYGFSQRNIADDVYDGVFKDLKITDSNGIELYSNELKGVEKGKYLIKIYFENVLNWFIKNL